MKQARPVFPVALLFKGKEELNVQSKRGGKERLGSLSFLSPEGTECRFFKTVQVASQHGRQDGGRNGKGCLTWDLKPVTEKNLNMPPLSGLPTTLT